MTPSFTHFRTVLPLLGGANFTAEQLDSLLGIAFGVSGAAIPNTNYIAELQVGVDGGLLCPIRGKCVADSFDWMYQDPWGMFTTLPGVTEVQQHAQCVVLSGKTYADGECVRMHRAATLGR